MRDAMFFSFFLFFFLFFFSSLSSFIDTRSIAYVGQPGHRGAGKDTMCEKGLGGGANQKPRVRGCLLTVVSAEDQQQFSAPPERER